MRDRVVPRLGRTDGYEDDQSDCEKSEAAHGMNPLIDNTEAVSREFLET